jgi:hypothetical protein
MTLTDDVPGIDLHQSGSNLPNWSHFLYNREQDQETGTEVRTPVFLNLHRRGRLKNHILNCLIP